LHTSKIKYPISQNIAARWMRESGFCYCGHKKSYYVLTYEYIVDITKAQDASAGKFRIEHITKLVKNHRSALDSDYGFISNS
jgi:hypothetical protein